MAEVRLRLLDWWLHRVYWSMVRRHGTACERVTDIAERIVDVRLALGQLP